MPITRRARSGTLFLLALGLAACADSPTAPAVRAPQASEPLFARSGASDRDGDSDTDSYSHNERTKSGTRTFRVRPGKAVLKKLGEHVLFMPADVICDPATSGYGPSYWDAPCRILDRPIEITATWEIVDGQAIIHFSPELRFAPETSLARSVTLWAKSSKDIDVTKYYTILWFNPETVQWVDESLTDPSLKAQTDKRGKLVYRRLKHFSTYRVWAGRRGGYNVTSG